MDSPAVATLTRLEIHSRHDYGDERPRVWLGATSCSPAVLKKVRRYTDKVRRGQDESPMWKGGKATRVHGSERRCGAGFESVRPSIALNRNTGLIPMSRCFPIMSDSRSGFVVTVRTSRLGMPQCVLWTCRAMISS